MGVDGAADGRWKGTQSHAASRIVSDNWTPSQTYSERALLAIEGSQLSTKTHEDA